MPYPHDPALETAPRTARQELASRCRAITDARWFALTVFGVILANAALLGIETYPGLVTEWRHWLRS
ncbi:hypothetical protein [Streptomyces sp. NPDC087856]|uniref:hypothetical protein n=1 Tax=Streptomyces sp. NPDC087856 TaxID=3365811 RepID=UPI00382CEB05